MIAALFVEVNGPYSALPDVEPWDVTRDARLYAGPFPVVAHPPCQLWVNFASLNFKRYGGAHNRPGNDGGCFAAALEAIRKWGGVLEHPAGSYAWSTFNLKPPRIGTWTQHRAERDHMASWTCEVWQSAYGHRARKRTWLYYIGKCSPSEMDWTRAPGDAQIGWFDRVKPTLSKREACRTPVEFRDALLGLARSACG